MAFAKTFVNNYISRFSVTHNQNNQTWPESTFRLNPIHEINKIAWLSQTTENGNLKQTESLK